MLCTCCLHALYMPCTFVLNLSQRLDLWRPNKHAALQNCSVLFYSVYNIQEYLKYMI